MSIRAIEVLSAAKDVMYHVTLKANLPSIQKVGLLPAKKPTGLSKGMANWQRNSIYFSSSVAGATGWLQMLSSGSDSLDEEKAKQYCILK